MSRKGNGMSLRIMPFQIICIFKMGLMCRLPDLMSCQITYGRRAFRRPAYRPSFRRPSSDL